MSLVKIPKQVPTSNQLKVQKTHRKKPQSGNAFSFVNNIMNRGSFSKFDKSLGLDVDS
jgi:hypothetical protein